MQVDLVALKVWSLFHGAHEHLKLLKSSLDGISKNVFLFINVCQGIRVALGIGLSTFRTDCEIAPIGQCDNGLKDCGADDQNSGGRESLQAPGTNPRE